MRFLNGLLLPCCSPLPIVHSPADVSAVLLLLTRRLNASPAHALDVLAELRFSALLDLVPLFRLLIAATNRAAALFVHFGVS